MNQQVIYIASMDHSGSTMLAKMLGGHPKLISVGEVFLTFKLFKSKKVDIHKRICTCGDEASICLLWRVVLEEWSLQKGMNYVKAYSILIKHFQKIYPDKILLDCSKYLPSLTRTLKIPEVEMTVIHLFKDVRTFTISRIELAKNKGKKLSYFHRFIFFKVWHRNNSMLEEFVKQKDLHAFKVGYEELCFNKYYIMNAMLSFANLEFDPVVLKASSSDSHHQLIGNKMRNDPKREQIVYDTRWLVRKEWIAPSLLYPKIMRYNHKNVYSNLN